MKLPDEAPVMILPDATLFPQAMLPLRIFEPRYRRMLRDVLHSGRMFVVAMQKPGRVFEKPSRVAGLGLVRASVRNRDGTSNLMLQGLARVELGRATRRKPYRVHSIRAMQEAPAENLHVDALMAKVRELVDELARHGLEIAKVAASDPSTPMHGGKALPVALAKSIRQLTRALANTKDPARFADLVSCAMLLHAGERQFILETLDVEQRLVALVRFLIAEIRRRRKPHTS